MIPALLFYPALGILLFLAFALLALTQFPHRRATGTVELPPRQVAQARLTALLLLVLSLAWAIRHDGAGFGSLLWAALISLTACAVALILGWRPGLLAPIARLMPGLRRRLPEKKRAGE